LEKLGDTEHAEVGSELAGQIQKKIALIDNTQKAKILNIMQKMNLFYENNISLSRIKEDIGMLENLVLDVGGILEERVEVPETLAVSVPAEKGIGPWEIIRLKVGVSNPSEKNKRLADIKYPLPREATPSCVINTSGLALGYDFAKECFYVFENDIELEPAETKTFLIELKDIWRIPEVEMEAFEAHANNILLLLKGTENFEQGETIAERVFFNLAEIEKSQNLKVAPPAHIAYYRDNMELFGEVKKAVAKLEKLTIQSGSSPGVTIVRAERLRGGGAKVKRPRGYEGIALIAKTIFRGKAPTVATTWKIIFIIIGFVAIVSVVFFALWHTQVKQERRKKEERK
jgi:hypothetical protein